MSGVVFDTEAIIAYLYREPGHHAVADRLAGVFDGETDGWLTETNASEVFYFVARFEADSETPTTASLRAADRDIRTLSQKGIEIEQADWRHVAEVKADSDLSLADAYAVALAHDQDATLVAGEAAASASLPVDISVQPFSESE